ncbi:MAG TPA: SGNH/GDSL hydrolase family protein [Polyangiaceae bacterium]|nr:SGNH/GDSL hydrolase family protein [Polyangiaceae bacterium]
MIPWSGPNAPLRNGRFVEVKDGLRFAWSGSALAVHFRGTAVSVDASDKGGNHFLVLVDGKPKREKVILPSGRATVELVSGLPRGEHTVTLYRLNEPAVGETTVHGFVLDAYGEALPTPTAPERRLEIIGDSISAGYGNEGPDEKCSFSPETENHFLTYGARASREVGAALTTLAWSGRGVASNRGSTTETETMGVLWTRSLPADPASTWSFSSPAPDAVLINLGTNDFAPEVADIAPFGPAYAKLLDDVRARYPRAQLLVALGPALSDDFPPGRRALSTAREVLRGLVEERTKAGDASVHFLEFARVRPEEGFGCDWHPSVATHTRMAGELVGALRKHLGW